MSNRNFDSRTIIHRLQEQNNAQSLYKTQQLGKQIISNPQTSDPSPTRVLSYKEGVQTTYYKNLKEGYTVSTSGITNLVTK